MSVNLWRSRRFVAAFARKIRIDEKSGMALESGSERGLTFTLEDIGPVACPA